MGQLLLAANEDTASIDILELLHCTGVGLCTPAASPLAPDYRSHRYRFLLLGHPGLLSGLLHIELARARFWIGEILGSGCSHLRCHSDSVLR